LRNAKSTGRHNFFSQEIGFANYMRPRTKMAHTSLLISGDLVSNFFERLGFGLPDSAADQGLAWFQMKEICRSGPVFALISSLMVCTLSA
jgi:hypothetical protein